MFHMPQLYNTRNYLNPVRHQDAQALDGHCTFLAYPCDERIYWACTRLMENANLSLPNDPYKLLDTYIWLRERVDVNVL